MTVIADITVPADAFPLGRVLEDVPDVEIELERIVPLQEAIIPLFWISGAERATIETTLRDHPETETVEVLTSADDETLYEVHWKPDINGLVRALVETRAKILEATGTAESWDFRLRFASHEDLSEFNVALTSNDMPVTLRHIYNPTPPEAESALSPEQRDVLLTAYRRGYFEVPRRTTLSELADDADVSDSALSQHIRRATNALVEGTLLVDDDATVD